MSGGYGDYAGLFIVLIKHGGFEDFAKSSAKVNSDEKLKAQQEEQQKNPKLKWVRAGLLIEEDIQKQLLNVVKTDKRKNQRLLE